MIKVFDYIESDIDNMKFNKWARHLKSSKNLKRIKQYLKMAYSYTLYDDKPVAILAFDEYAEDKYDGCIIADECFSNNPKYAIKMKWLIGVLAEKMGATRVQTLSEDSPELNKWHEFLGFKLEIKDAETIKGIRQNLWGMEWEQQQH